MPGRPLFGYDQLLKSKLAGMNDPGKTQSVSPVWSVVRQNNLESQNEIIRRLRIQNKKLLEQVSHVKKGHKKLMAERTNLLQQLKEQKRLNRTLSKLISHSIKSGKDQPVSHSNTSQ